MADTNTNKTTARKTTARAAQPVKVEAAEKPIVPKTVDLNQYVTVKNGFQGRLIYRSRRTGETFDWEEFGDEQEMELRELSNAKNSCKEFFVKNWFMFGPEDDWVIDYLGVRRFYQGAIPIESFDDIFDQDAETLKATIAGLSEGQKKSVAYRAHELISENKIDSLSVIHVLESSLNIDLIEK